MRLPFPTTFPQQNSCQTSSERVSRDCLSLPIFHNRISVKHPVNGRVSRDCLSLPLFHNRIPAKYPFNGRVSRDCISQPLFHNRISVKHPVNGRVSRDCHSHFSITEFLSNIQLMGKCLEVEIEYQERSSPYNFHTMVFLQNIQCWESIKRLLSLTSWLPFVFPPSK
jgi:hypothetical protein